jgi:hypothetical protein
MENNLNIYNAVRSVPAEAQKQIDGGRLKNKIEINPMWRLKTLTEQFGPCGIGWRYEIIKQWLEPSTSEEITAFTTINLYIKYEGEWSEAIPGTGGSSFLTKEKDRLYTNDNCYKMALTDALSVACKALGIGADIYWDKDKKEQNFEYITAAQAKLLFVGADQDIVKAVITEFGYESTKTILKKDFDNILKRLTDAKLSKNKQLETTGEEKK